VLQLVLLVYAYDSICHANVQKYSKVEGVVERGTQIGILTSRRCRGCVVSFLASSCKR
jgi:hypothetical protein